MLNIVRVAPSQFAEMMMKISKENRFTMPEFPTTNIYLAEFRTLIVLKDEVFLNDFPETEDLSIASAVHAGWSK